MDNTDISCQSLINAAPVAMMAVADGRFLFSNQAGAEMLGYSTPAEVIGLEIWDCVTGEYHDALRQCYKNVNLGIQNDPLELQIRKPDGAKTFVETRLAPADCDDRKIALIVGQDISDKKVFEETLNTVFCEISYAKGKDFFKQLVRLLAKTMGCRYGFAGEVDQAGKRIRTLSIWTGEDYGKNFSYDLEGTPCSTLRDSIYCFFPDRVQERFPDHEWLMKMNVKSYSGCPMRDPSGEFFGVIGIMDDKPLNWCPQYQALLQLISMRAAAELLRQQSEDALIESEAKYRVIVENTPDIIAHCSADGKFEYISKAAEIYTGIRAEDFIGKSVDEMGFPLTFSRFWKSNTIKVLTTGEPHETEFGFDHKKQRLTCNVRLIPRKNEFEEVVSIVYIIRDITEHREIERAYRALFDRMLDGFAVHEMIFDDHGNPVDYRFLQVNPAFEKLTGLASDDIIGRRVLEVLPNTEPFWIETYGNVVKTGNPTRFENYSIEIDRYFEVEAFRPQPDQFACIFQDVTVQRKSEIALRDSEKRYRTLLETVNDAIITFTEDSKIIYWNPGAEKMFEYEENDLENLPFMSLFSSESSMVIRKQLSHLHEKGASFSGDLGLEVVAEKRTGHKFQVEISFATWTNERDLFYTVLIRDISDRKRIESERFRLEKQLQHAQKMESIGTLAGGFAHDFNNILQPVLGYSSMAYSMSDKSSQIGKFLGQILQSSRRARDMVKLMLDFSRRNLVNTEAVELQLVIAEVLGLVEASVPASIKIIRNISSEALPVMADQTQIHQIMMNLITNASQAIFPRKRNGTIEITLRAIYDDDPVCCSNPSAKPGNFVFLCVKDDGIGMDEITLERVFEPFFTTKSPGKGTGLGLSVVHGIISSMGGEVAISSKVEEGTTVCIFIPLLEKGIIEAPAGENTQGWDGERILFVDDNKDAAKVAVEMLDLLGYKTRGVTAPKRALQLFCQNPFAYKLVFVELQMLDLSGEELIVEIRKIRPDCPIIAITGSLVEEAIPRLRNLGVHHCLPKPLISDELNTAIGELLN